MPELPEVEALRRGLVKYVVGQKIKKVTVTEPKLVSGRGNMREATKAKTQEFIRGLTGQKVIAIERRAKNLIFKFESGKLMLVHLKMTGQLIYREHGHNRVIGGHPIELAEQVLPNKHSHIIFELTRPLPPLYKGRLGGVLYYNDTRKFGYLLYYPDLATFERTNHFAKIGLEPFDRNFTADYLFESLKSRNRVLKSALIDQSIVTGLGNIYCDEVCFAARVRPTRRTDTVTLKEARALHAATKRILLLAIKLGGSSIANYRLADGSRGNYAREHKVYGHSGGPCSVCRTPLVKTTVGNRTTVFCKKCQR